MEKLIKSALGQWKIVNETSPELKKAWVKDPKDSSGAKRFNAAFPTLSGTDIAPRIAQDPNDPSSKQNMHKQNRHILNGLFDTLDAASQSGNDRQVEQVKGAIKNHVLTQKPGDIDFGHLGKKREALANSTPGGGKPFKHRDMEELINHHMKGDKSLKDIHDNHGGVDAVETVMRQMGANGTPEDYANMDVHPTIHADLNELTGNSWKGDEDRKKHGLAGTQYTGGFDPALHKDALDTYDAMSSSGPYVGGTWGNEEMKDHEDAVIKRGMKVFKDHHGL